MQWCSRKRLHHRSTWKNVGTLGERSGLRSFAGEGRCFIDRLVADDGCITGRAGVVRLAGAVDEQPLGRHSPAVDARGDGAGGRERDRERLASRRSNPRSFETQSRWNEPADLEESRCAHNSGGPAPASLTRRAARCFAPLCSRRRPPWPRPSRRPRPTSCSACRGNSRSSSKRSPPSSRSVGTFRGANCASPHAAWSSSRRCTRSSTTMAPDHSPCTR